MSQERTPQEKGHRQSRLNTIILMILVGLCSVFIGLLAWLGNDVVSQVRETSRTVVDVRLALTGIQTDVSNLKTQMREVVMRTEFNAAVAEIHNKLDNRDREILELKKEIGDMRRQRGLSSSNKP